MNFGKQVRKYRQAAELSQAELAKAVGAKSGSTVTMWETGERIPSARLLPKIAEVLGCEINDLFEKGG